VEELCHQADLEEMENLTVGIKDAFSNEDGEAVKPDDDPPRISFGPDQSLVPGNVREVPWTPPALQLRDKAGDFEKSPPEKSLSGTD
jgi:hypothetical protein